MESQTDHNPIELEFQEIDKNKGAWNLAYEEIRSQCSKFDYTLIEAKKTKNKNLNRYRDVSPYDHTRIVLSKGSSDYINASLVKMKEANRQYILTQGPLPNTTSHFWLMVWEQKCKAVLMLNKIIEKNQVKCHQYWPIGSKNGGEDIMEFKDVDLKVELISETDGPYFSTRVLRLTDVESGSSRDILHFHYMTWPDFGVPQSPTVFLRFLNKVRRSGALDESVGPPVVHCSAGIGRSGTFCLVDTCLILIKDNGCDNVKVRDILLDMRRQRMGLIQTPDQLRFSYLAILEGMKTDWDSINDNDPVEEEVNANHVNYDDEEPPPLPPPRGDSLKAVVNSDHSPTTPDLPPLPSAPPHSSSSSEEPSQPPSPGNGTTNSSEGMRKRKHEDRLESLKEKLQDMKTKQQQTERWNKIKRGRKKRRRNEVPERAKQ
ncbi:tyrosine-protein phosphatase non-receptor type 2-like isoform X2 [Macrosteles quadrilineatus]|uniref:tyrosine-protein phosphatase non-receptor type 2-like isoform X2 n=1 Tax=Macrosteles quadrilineatus TaxID=74068 RepID=UPI0023E2B2BA|nr:tyrosine-protein phosphatase non-receptor type 2-like isoform X2 [Macrosteles quadrilineatus]